MIDSTAIGQPRPAAFRTHATRVKITSVRLVRPEVVKIGYSPYISSSPNCFLFFSFGGLCWSRADPRDKETNKNEKKKQTMEINWRTGQDWTKLAAGGPASYIPLAAPSKKIHRYCFVSPNFRSTAQHLKPAFNQWLSVSGQWQSARRAINVNDEMHPPTLARLVNQTGR